MIHKDIPPCPFCGGSFYIYEEGECGAHPGETWYMVNHSCFVDIDILQKGGDIQDLKTALSMRYKADE